MIKEKQHQFAHINAYSRSAPKNSKQWTISDVLGEIFRSPEHSGHVKAPICPEIIFGNDKDDIVEQLEILSSIKTKSGRKLRKDAKVLLAGVASYPKSISKLSKNDESKLQSWELATRNFLYRKYGNRLVSIVKHTDETFPHLHFLIIPDFHKGEMMDDVHPGMKRRKACKGGKHAKQAEMVAGLVDFQDEYYKEVSQHFSHSRISQNPKARQKYAFWQRYKAMNNTIHKLTIKMKGLITWNDFTMPEKGQKAREREI